MKEGDVGMVNYERLEEGGTIANKKGDRKG
jgi:hypothetical protein